MKVKKRKKTRKKEGLDLFFPCVIMVTVMVFQKPFLLFGNWSLEIGIWRYRPPASAMLKALRAGLVVKMVKSYVCFIHMC